MNVEAPGVAARNRTVVADVKVFASGSEAFDQSRLTS